MKKTGGLRKTMKGGGQRGGLMSRLFKKSRKSKSLNKSSNLYLAVRRHDINVVKDIIRKRPDLINERLTEENIGHIGKRGLTLIQYFYYDQDMVNFLLKHGADIDKKDLYGKSLLDYYKHFISVHSVQKTKEYYTLDNGGHPFIVEIKNDYGPVNVYVNNENEYVYPPIFLHTIKARRIFIGKESPNYKYKLPNNEGDGNSILIHLDKNKYRFIGATIFDFETINGDAINKLVSNIGNSAVPYPYAIGKDHIYIFNLDSVSAIKKPKDYIKDPIFMNVHELADNEIIPIKSIMIHERLW